MKRELLAIAALLIVAAWLVLIAVQCQAVSP